jgi:mRNA-degrading endonuclease toxin of MazEF toxin-antitoxin module
MRQQEPPQPDGVTPDFCRRGFIYRAKLGKERTVLVVSADFVNEFMHPVVVLVTSKHRIRVFETDVPLRAGEGGLTENSYALCHDVTTLVPEAIEPQPIGGVSALRGWHKLTERSRSLLTCPLQTKRPRAASSSAFEPAASPSSLRC